MYKLVLEHNPCPLRSLINCLFSVLIIHDFITSLIFGYQFYFDITMINIAGLMVIVLLGTQAQNPHLHLYTPLSCSVVFNLTGTNRSLLVCFEAPHFIFVCHCQLLSLSFLISGLEGE